MNKNGGSGGVAVAKSNADGGCHNNCSLSSKSNANVVDPNGDKGVTVAKSDVNGDSHSSVHSGSHGDVASSSSSKKGKGGDRWSSGW